MRLRKEKHCRNDRFPAAVCLLWRSTVGFTLGSWLIQRLQHPFSANGEVPPWLGMYGFGEFARLAGINTYHNYTTAIAALYRKTEAP